MHSNASHFRKVIALLLSIILLVNLVPITALADIRSTINNTPEQNQAILDSLRQLYGDGVTSGAAQQQLGELGLLNENGEVAVTATIDLDGEQLTLDQVRQLVFAPDADLDKLVSVDGTSITLGDLKLMIEIEDELQRIQDTYFGEVTLTPEQQAALDSLREQINSEGIMISAAELPPPLFPSGIDHRIYIDVTTTPLELANGSGEQSVTVTLKDDDGNQLAAVPNYDISLSYRFVDGSAQHGLNYTAADGTLTFAANSATTAQQIPLTLLDDTGRWDGQKTFLIQYFNPINALLPSGRRAAETLVKINGDFSFGVMPAPFYTRSRVYEPGGPPAGIGGTGGSTLPLPPEIFAEGLVDSVRLDIEYDAWGFNTVTHRPTICFGPNYWDDANGYRFPDFVLTFTDEGGIQSFTYSEDIAYKPGMYADLQVVPYVTTSIYLVGWGVPTYQITRSSQKLFFLDTIAPQVTSVSIPEGTTFEYGQSVPITVEYSEPVNPSTATLNINGVDTLPAVESGSRGVRMATFLYPVKQVDGTSLIVTNVTGAVDMLGNPQADYTLGSLPSATIMKGVNKSDAFTTAAASAVVEHGQMQGSVTLQLHDNPLITTWVLAEAAANYDPDLEQYRVPSIYASLDGGITKIDLYADNADAPTALIGSFNPEFNTTGASVERAIEFYLDPDLASTTNHQLLVGTYDIYTVPPAIFLAEDDLALTYTGWPADGSIFAEDGDRIVLGYTNANPGATWVSPKDFVWTSSDPKVASISQSGLISPTGTTGVVSFTLTALNGGVEGKAISLTSEPLTIKAGLTPFLSIPAGANTITIKEGSPAEVRWTSNLIAKNAELGSETEFLLEMLTADYSSGGLQWDESSPLFSQIVSASPENPVASYVIPAEHLSDVSVIGRHSYVVQISSVDPISGATLSTTGYITILSQPAIVQLAPLPSYFITDSTTNVPVAWALQHFDTVNGGEFQLAVTDNANSKLIYQQTETGNTGGNFGLTIPPVENGFKDIYTVAVQAKNSADSTWSYDSFVLHVYRDAALQVWIDGVPAGSEHTMSNIPEISGMTSAEILALQRDIYLKNVISINFGEHAWGQIRDQIKWRSSDSSVASVNYRQGSLYENIENFTYASYRPATEFILSGLSNGVTQVTATHAATGKTEAVQVRVNTLKDKLYLFQVYPRAVTTLTYVNGDGEQCSVQTDETGALALYEESGIKSDVYLQSTFNEREYWGTIYNERLLSSEQDSTKLQLYPENNFRLREVATVELYFKRPDATPYAGEVTLRGGVYKNGLYCPEALLNSVSGESDQLLSIGADGRFTVKMDSTQFWTTDTAEVLQPQDKLQFVFEVRFPGDTYFPQLLMVDGNMNRDEVVRFGASAVRVTEVSAADREKPFLSTQQVIYPRSTSINVTEFTGSLGLSDKWEQLTLESYVLWWGETDIAGQDQHRLLLQDQYGTAPKRQTNQTFYYPFSTIKVTKHTFTLDRTALQAWVLPKESRTLTATIYDGSGDQYKQQALPWRIVNMTGVEDAADSDGLVFLLQTVGKNSAADSHELSLSDTFVAKGLEFLGNLSVESEMFSMVVRPTVDPTVFKGLIMLNLGNMANDNATGVYSDDNISGDLDYAPSAMDMQKMAKGQYLAEQQKKLDYNKSHARSQRSRDISYAIGGYMEVEIKYNFDQEKWEVIILNGGFNAGGGVSYSWNYNAWAGPVPVTAQLTVGATAEVSFKAAVQHTSEGTFNDYLTTLRLYAYVRVFGGLGHDYTVVALKIGLFGQISVDAQFAFLNQPYESAEATTGQKLNVNGKVGIEFVAKFLFVSYEKVLASLPFNIYERAYGDWNYIQNLWSRIEQGSSDAKMVGRPMLLADNSLVYPVAERAIIEDRDYLEQFDRTWVTPGRFSLFALDPVSGVKDLQTNAYPYSNPVLSDDGQLMVYISDGDSTAVEDTQVSWTRLSGGSYPSGSPIETTGDGHGDSQLKLSGSSDFAAATWVRQTASLHKEAGEAITYSDVALMSNSTEVMVAVFNGSEWTTTRLTNNASPDLAPVVATSGNRILVAWRSVYPADASDPLNFSTHDSILYRVYQDGVWSETNTLYNGTSGAVKGLEAAMLRDGTAAVTYTIDTAGRDFALSDGQGVESGLEAVYAIVGTDGVVQKNVRLTNDSYLDENPQITTVGFEDGSEWFVLGWHSVHDADGVSLNDIRLCAFDQGGNLHPDFLESISSVNEYSSVSISSNFRFVRNAESITDLAILWTEQADSGDINTSSTTADKDLLKAVKFRSDNGRIYITSAFSVAEMPDFTLVNHFDAYITGDSSVKAVILGTSYDNGYEPTGLLVGSSGEKVDLLTATPQSNLYTATGSFQNSVEVRSVAVDYQAVVRGMRISAQFSLFNSGLEPVTSINLQVGENTAEFTDLYLLPNETITLTTYYDIPGDRVINPQYTVTASFADETFALSDTLYLAIPDVGVSKLESLREQDGERLLQVTLYNLSDIQLSGSDRIVKLGFYSDADLTNAVMAPLTISSAAELSLIDAGAFTKQVTFDIQEYLGLGQEIPDGGVRIYAKAWIEEPISATATGEIMEYYPGNNVQSILFESLLVRHDGKPATVSTEQVSEGGATRVSVEVQNNSLVNVSSGNLIARLLDSQGNELETLQSYDPEAVNQGLIQLGAEGVAAREFSFSQTGSRVSVTYSNAVITDSTNANLAALTLSEIPLKFEAGVTEYSINVREMRNTTVSVVAEDPKATLQINGQAGGLANVRLHAGWNNITVTVTAADGQTKQDYVVMVYNYVPGSEPAIWPTIIQNPGGKVSYSTSGLVTVTPDQGYCVKDLLVNGKSVGAVTSYQVPSSTVAYRLEALFGPATGLITIKQNNGGTVVVSEDGLSVAITPDEGFRIQDVLVDGASVGAVSSYDFDPPAAPHELEVIFAPIVGTISVLHNPGGTVRVSEDGLSVSITPNQGYRIKDVLVDGVSVGAVKSYVFTEPGQDHTVQVVFEPVGDVLAGYADVASHWARGVIAFSIERGLLVRTSTTTFSPNLPITRAMLVTVLMRLHGGRPQALTQFSDVPSGAWYAHSVAWAVENGIAGSVGGNAFAPNRAATREELAQIVINYCRFAGIDLPQAEVIAFDDIDRVSSALRAAVTDMQQAGLMTGRGSNRFVPQGTLTRAEFASVLYRLIVNILGE